MTDAERQSTERYLERVFGITIRETDDINIFTDIGLRNALRERRRNGEFNAETGTLTFYTPNVGGTVGNLEGQVTYLLVAEKGLRGALGDARFLSVFRDFAQRVHGVANPARDVDMAAAERMLAEMSPSQDDAWDVLAGLVRSELKITYPAISLAGNLAAANRYHSGKKTQEAIRNRDYRTLDATALVTRMNENRLVSIGPLSDAFERLEYPDTEMYISQTDVNQFLLRESLDKDMLQNAGIASLFQNPLAIFKGKVREGETVPKKVSVVTDLFVKGKGFLSYEIDTDREVSSSLSKNPGFHLKARNFSFWSPWRLLCASTFNNGESILYLQEDGAADKFKMDKAMDAMRGKTDVELGKKSGAEAPLSFSATSVDQRLRCWTNVSINFRNPKGRTYFEHLKGEYFKTHAPKQENPKEDVPVASVTKLRHRKSFRERLFDIIPSKSFTPTAYRKLENAGIIRINDLISAGEDGVRSIAGPRAVRDAVELLSSKGLRFETMTRRTEVTDSITLTAEEMGKFRTWDFFQAICDMPSGKDLTSIALPRDSSGRYYTGATAATMVAKLATIERWEDCNIFLSTDDLTRFGLHPESYAEPCYVNADGNTEIVYNLADTDLRFTDPVAFKRIIDESCRDSERVSRYMSVFLPSLKGCELRNAVKLYDFIEGKESISTGIEGRAILPLDRYLEAKWQPDDKIYFVPDSNDRLCALYFDGTPALGGLSFLEVSRAEDGVCTVTLDRDHMQLVDMRKGEFVGPIRPVIGKFKDGWAYVRAGVQDGAENKGKINFVNRFGGLITRKWLDKAGEFNNGEMQAIRNNVLYKVNKEGFVTESTSLSPEIAIRNRQSRP